MKEWFTAAELVARQLPGLPSSKSGVIRLAKKQAWKSALDTAGNPLARRRQGRGGGWEYHYTLLPTLAQFKLVREATPKADTKKPPHGTSEMWGWYARQPDKKKKVALDRAEALKAVQALQRGGIQMNLAAHEVARQNGIGRSTLFTWLEKVAGVDESDWLPHLCPRHAGRTKRVECHPEAWELLKRLYLTDEQREFTFCYDLVKDAAAEHGWTVPAPRTLERRLMTEVPRAVRVYWREGSEAAARLYPHQERDRSMFHALEAVNADGHKWDVFVRWPDGEISRPIMLAIQDLYSGKIVAWRVDRTENAELVRLAFRDCFEDYGIPDLAFLDNGRGFAAKCITGGVPTRYRFKVKPEDPLGILPALGVEARWTRPYSGQSKPIERAFGEFCQRIAKHPVFEGAWTGNRPDAKPESYASKAVDLETFLGVVGQGIVKYNARAARRTRVCAGVHSFDQAFRESYERAPIRKAQAEHLRMCLLAAEAVRANPQSGAINLMGNRYWSEALVELAGRPLTVRFDPEDLHDGVHVYRQDGVYVGLAECLEAVGFADAAAARDHARKRKAYRKGLRELAELERSMTLDQMIEALPDVEEPEVPEAKVVRMVQGNTAIAATVEQDPDSREDADAAFFRDFRAGLRLIQARRQE